MSINTAALLYSTSPLSQDAARTVLIHDEHETAIFYNMGIRLSQTTPRACTGKAHRDMDPVQW